MVKYLFILFSFSFAVVTVSPDGSQDFTTIQAAIDYITITPTETVIEVYPGTYQENLIIEADMIIRSVDNAYNTIIDGSLGRGLGSTIVIRPESGNPHKPMVEINGFGIKNGKGSEIKNKTITLEDGSHPIDKVGGGLLVYVNTPKINNNKFLDNGDNSTDKGGAIFASSAAEDCDFSSRDDYVDAWNLEPAEGLLDYSYNTFLGNDANQGNSVYIIGNGYDQVTMAGDSLDVFSSTYNNASEYWVISAYDIDYNNASGKAEAIYSDVWVDPLNGIDEDNTSGDENNPFLTINYAMGMIFSTEDNPLTIHLIDGTYSPSNNDEPFPIYIYSHMNLRGDSEEGTILNAEESGRVVVMDGSLGNTLMDFTITGGLQISGENSSDNPYNYSGGGMLINFSSPILTNISIIDNNADNGGGLYLYYSDPLLTNMYINGNRAEGSGGSGGGMFLQYSNPILSNVIISENFAHTSGGLNLFYSNPILTNVIINGNTSYSWGAMLANRSDPTLTNVTISENTSGYYGPSVSLYISEAIIKNTIIWNNMAESPWNVPLESLEIFYYPSEADPPSISYSDIQINDMEGVAYEIIQQGVGNKNENPLFNEPEIGDFTLQNGSPCIDSGDPSAWYLDMDGSTSDMGVTGGLFLTPNFISYDFGEIGDIESTADFTLSNSRLTPITIESVSFSGNTFSTTTSFPIVINPLQTGVIRIGCVPENIGSIEENMVLNSPDLSEDLTISLSVTGSDGNILSGELSGTLYSATYRITGDINVVTGDELTLLPGTEFLFNGDYGFTVEGVLKAEGTEQDSIIFKNYDNGEFWDDEEWLEYCWEMWYYCGNNCMYWYCDENWPGNYNWQGITLENVTEETVFDYVRISGAKKANGAGMALISSNPILSNMTIDENMASNYSGYSLGAGMYLVGSNPSLANVLIARNEHEWNGHGGGMYLIESNPKLVNVTIESNGNCMFLSASNPILVNSIMWSNGLANAIYLDDGYEEPIIIYSNIDGGWEGEGNIDDNPLFISPENGDFTLHEDSPCIDAGTDYFEYDGEIIVDIPESDYYGSAPDMGRFEWYPAFILGDFTEDGQIDVLDVVALVANILSDGEYNPAGDLIEDGVLNVLDIVALVNLILGGG